MLRKQITAIQRCRAMVDVIGRINDTSKQIENIISEIEDIASQTNLFHSMQLSRQRVQVRQVKDSQLLRDKSEVFQSRVPRLQLTHVSL